MHSDEFKQRLRERCKGADSPFAGKTWWALGLPHPLLGKTFSEESRQKMSRSAKLRKRTFHCSEEEQKVRQEAHERGDKYYFFPRPCKRGHIAKRFVKSSSCCKCSQDQANQRIKTRLIEEPELMLYHSAQQRAKKCGWAFTISAKDIKDAWPKDGLCPILRIKLERCAKTCDQSATLDRVVAEQGYVPGNIAVISHRANRIKQMISDPCVFDALAAWLSDAQHQAHGGHVCLSPQSRCPCYKMWDTAKRQAQKSGILFNLIPDDVRAVWPANNCCPIFKTPLKRNSTKGPSSTSPSLDKIVPRLGYVRGNIAIMSHLANRMKNDVTDPEIFRKIAAWLRQQKAGSAHA